jgi:hypothetical protein
MPVHARSRICAACLDSGREPGCAPGGAVTFSCLAKRKSPKRKRPYTLRPFASLRATCGARFWRGLAKTCAPRRILKGTPGNGHPHGPLLRWAALGPERAGAARRDREAERSKGPYGCSAVPPLQAAPAAGRLRGGMGVGAPMLRELTHRSCPSGAAQQRSEFCGAPRNRPAAGLPRSAAKGPQTGGRLFFGDFLLAKQKKVTRTPGDSRPPP